MNTYDLIVLISLLLGAYRGYKKGFIRELTGLLGIILALWFAWKWMGPAGFWMKDILAGNHFFLPVFAFVAVFGVLITAFVLFARFATKLLDLTLVLGVMNRVSGAGVAAFQVFLFLMLFTWIADRAGLLSPELKQDSRAYPVTASAGPFLYQISEKYFPKSDSLMEEWAGKVHGQGADE